MEPESAGRSPPHRPDHRLALGTEPDAAAYIGTPRTRDAGDQGRRSSRPARFRSSWSTRPARWSRLHRSAGSSKGGASRNRRRSSSTRRWIGSKPVWLGFLESRDRTGPLSPQRRGRPASGRRHADHDTRPSIHPGPEKAHRAWMNSSAGAPHGPHPRRIRRCPACPACRIRRREAHRWGRGDHSCVTN